MTRITTRSSAVLALLAVLALALSACGSSSDSSSGSSTDAATLLRDTFGADHPIHSGRVDADLDVAGLSQLGNQPLSLHISGPFQSNGGTKLPDFALGVDFQGGTNPVTVGAVFAKGGGYLTIEGQAFDLGKDVYNAFKQGYQKAKADSATKGKGKGQPTLSALGIEPLRWLTDPKTAGTEDIAGTQTEHVTSGVDVPKLLDDVSTLLGKAKDVTSSAGSATGTSVPTQLTAAQRAKIVKSIKSAKVDVWTGAKDHTLRKVAVNVQLQSGHVIFQVTLAQLNQPQTINKPAGAKPLSELRAVLQQMGLLGSSSATSSAPSTTSTPSTTTTPAPSGTQADYANCISSAGDDLAKVQACAKYLK
ncbi:MAG TPA: hypothetical protein VI318_18360 [Baekduia sp.]